MKLALNNPHHLAILSATVLAFSLAIAFGITGAQAGLSVTTAAGTNTIVTHTPSVERHYAAMFSAQSQGSAEAALLRRIIEIAQTQGLTVQSASFDAKPAVHGMTLAFELEGSQAAVWKTVIALETASPTVVLTRITALARDNGNTLSLRGEAQAFWSSAEREAQRDISSREF